MTGEDSAAIEEHDFMTEEDSLATEENSASTEERSAMPESASAMIQECSAGTAAFAAAITEGAGTAPECSAGKQWGGLMNWRWFNPGKSS